MVDIDLLEKYARNPNYTCGVCIGLSPRWDGHDIGCEGWVREQTLKLIDEIREERK